MSTTGRELNAPLFKPAVVAAASTRGRNGMDPWQSREPLPFKFPATSAPGVEHDATILDMMNDNSTWADIEAVVGPEAFDRYYTMLDPDLETFWVKEAIMRLNEIVCGSVEDKKPVDSNSNSNSDFNSAPATKAIAATDWVPMVDILSWDKIADSMGSSAAVCRYIWSTFGDGRPLSEQERVLLAMEEKRKKRRAQIEKLEQERIAKEKERARIKAEKQEQRRIAHEKEQARIEAEKQEQERVTKAEKEKKARLAAQQAKKEQERVALEKKNAERKFRAEERKRPAQTLVESEDTRRSTSSAAIAVGLATDSVPNGGNASWSHLELDVTTRQQRTRLQAQFSKIQHNKTLLEQAWKLRRQEDEDRKRELSVLLARQAACRIEYNRRNENENVSAHHQPAENDNKEDLVSPGKHILAGADNDTPSEWMSTASGLTCSPALYKTQLPLRSQKRPRPKRHPIFVPRFKEVIMQAEQQADLQRQAVLQQTKKSERSPSPVAFVHYVYVGGMGLVRRPAPVGSLAPADLTEAQKHGPGEDTQLQAIPTASTIVSKTRPLNAVAAGASSGAMSTTSSLTLPQKDVIRSPDDTDPGSNPYYDILTWTSEDIVGVWDFWVQYGDKWDHISKTVVSGRHSPQECQAFVMGAGFV